MRRRTGATIAEFAAVLMLGVPLLILLIYITIEVTHFFAIKAAMDVGARNAARALVVDFNNTQTEKPSIDLATWSFLKMPNYIANNSQFAVVWDDPTKPTQVTVSCTYGGPGLAPFPSGPLSYLNKNATFDINAFKVTGLYIMPVQ